MYVYTLEGEYRERCVRKTKKQIVTRSEMGSDKYM